jgi:RHS repeat-associated protein
VPALRADGPAWYLGPSPDYLVTNRLSSTGYDAAGNQTQLAISAGGTAALYDAEGRLAQVTLSGAAMVTNYYDAEGRRVKRTDVGGAATYFVYDAEGQLMAEYGVAGSVAGTQYVVRDHLGSTRMVQDGQGNCAMRLDYAPYGAVVPRSGQDCYTMTWSGPMFTGQLRDSASGLDYFGARHYWAELGRFTSPDPENAGANPLVTGSWNMYSYGLNNPLLYIDPSGRCSVKKGESVSTDDEGAPCELGPGQANMTVTDYEPPSPMLLAVARGAQQAGPVVEAAGIGTAAVMTGGFAGMGYGAFAGGSAMVAIPVTSGGTATAATYQLLKDSYRNLELVGEALSGVGQQLIAAGDKIRDVPRLVGEYGGKATDWVKLSTRGVEPSKMQRYAQQAGRGTSIQIHYYKNIVTGKIVEMKSVFTGIK